MTEEAFKLRNNKHSTAKRASLIGNDDTMEEGACIFEGVGCAMMVCELSRG